MESIDEALGALDEIWKVNGKGLQRLEVGLRLWHCGCSPTHLDLRDDLMLWTTRNEEERLHYAGIAKQQGAREKLSAALLELAVVRPLRAADFNRASLGEFTMKHCDANHDAMKAVVRAWCLLREFEAVVRINGGEHEVAVARPRSSLTLISSMPL
jgi:hypothetical protein